MGRPIETDRKMLVTDRDALRRAHKRARAGELKIDVASQKALTSALEKAIRIYNAEIGDI